MGSGFEGRACNVVAECVDHRCVEIVVVKGLWGIALGHKGRLLEPLPFPPTRHTD